MAIVDAYWVRSSSMPSRTRPLGVWMAVAVLTNLPGSACFWFLARRFIAGLRTEAVRG